MGEFLNLAEALEKEGDLTITQRKVVLRINQKGREKKLSKFEGGKG